MARTVLVGVRTLYVIYASRAPRSSADAGRYVSADAPEEAVEDFCYEYSRRLAPRLKMCTAGDITATTIDTA